MTLFLEHVQEKVLIDGTKPTMLLPFALLET